MNLDSRQGSGQGASINIEDLDEEFDNKRVRLVRYYTTESLDTMIMHSIDSHISVRDIVNRMISDGAGTLYEKYIETKINKYSLDLMHEFIHNIMEHVIILFDNKDFEENNNVDKDDDEPVRINKISY